MLAGQQRQAAARRSAGTAAPPGGEDAQEVGVGEQHRRSRRSRRAWPSTPVGPPGDVVERLAGAGSSAVQIDHAGIGRPQVGRARPLELAVVPLDEVVVDHRSLAHPGQLAGLAGPLQRAGEHRRLGGVRERGEERGELAGPALALGVEREIGAPGVPAIGGPLRLAVADQQDARSATSAHRTRHRRAVTGWCVESHPCPSTRSPCSGAGRSSPMVAPLRSRGRPPSR